VLILSGGSTPPARPALGCGQISEVLVSSAMNTALLLLDAIRFLPFPIRAELRSPAALFGNPATS
jgi:hypothetical protein